MQRRLLVILLLPALGLIGLLVAIIFGLSAYIAYINSEPLTIPLVLVLLGLSLTGATTFLGGLNDTIQLVERLRGKSVEGEQLGSAQDDLPDQGSSQRAQWQPSLPTHYLSRQADLAALRELVLGGNNELTGIIRKRLIGVYGMGGIGKSVAAAALIRDEVIRQAFPDGVYWLSFGEKLDESSLINRQVQLARSLGREQVVFADVQQGKAYLGDLLADKACLIILDDVWHLAQAQTLNVIADSGRSHILITTRDATLLVSLGAAEYRLDELNEDQALQLLADWAGVASGSVLPEAARAVASECAYLPLALVLCGAQIQSGMAWPKLLTNLREANLTFLDIYPVAERGIMASMKVGVDALPELQAQLYGLLAAVPEDTPIPEAALLTIWAHLVNQARIGNEPVTDLSQLITWLEQKSLLRTQGKPGQRWVTLHDMQHRYLRQRAEDMTDQHEWLLQAYAERCKDGWHSGPNDGYFFRQLTYHLFQAGHNEELRDLLPDPRWYQIQREINPTLRPYIQDIRHFLENAATQGLDGLPDVMAFGLLLGTLTTHVYELTREQIVEMIEGRQVDLLVEWSERLPPDPDWFRIDLLHVAGEVAALAGQTEKAIHLFRQTSEGITHIPTFMWPEHLHSLALDLATLNDEEGMERLLSTAEQMQNDFFMPPKQEIISALQEIHSRLKQGKVESLFRELNNEPYPAIKKVTSESYIGGASESFLRAAQDSAWTWARWAELLHDSGNPWPAQIAFIEAKRAYNLMESNRHEEKSRTLIRLVRVAAALGQQNEVEDFLDEATRFSSDENIAPSMQIGLKAELANLSCELEQHPRAGQLLRDVDSQLQRSYPAIQRAYLLAGLAPCSQLVTNPPDYLADRIKDEQLAYLVALSWETYAGSVEAAEALLESVSENQDGFLNYFLLRTLIYMLGERPDSSSLLMDSALAVSHQVLPETKWLEWLGNLLNKVHIDEGIRVEILQSLKATYNNASKEEQVRLALHIALPLSHFADLDQDWVLSIFRDVFCHQTPFHRAMILQAIEKFSPLILVLSGRESLLETWQRITRVERSFDSEFGL